MASLYAKYIEERTGDLILEYPNGYATYRYMDDGKTVYIVDIFVDKEFRKFGLAAKMADEIAGFAKVRECNRMVGSVVPGSKNSTDSILVLIAYGMRLSSSSDNFIVFEKEI